MVFHGISWLQQKLVEVGVGEDRADTLTRAAGAFMDELRKREVQAGVIFGHLPTGRVLHIVTVLSRDNNNPANRAGLAEIKRAEVAIGRLFNQPPAIHPICHSQHRDESTTDLFAKIVPGGTMLGEFFSN